MRPTQDDKHQREIEAAAEEYRQAADARRKASARLAEAMRAAYGDGWGQSKIIRTAGYVWSREYLRVILGLTKSSGDRATS